MKKILLTICATALLVGCSNKKMSGAADATGSGDSSTHGFLGTGQDKVGDRVFFAFDKSTLSDEAKATLDKQAEYMKANSSSKFIIEGHADERGTEEYNIALGERRANASFKYLVSKGIDANRLSVVSYGKTRPEALGHDEQSWMQNRRSVTVQEQK